MEPIRYTTLPVDPAWDTAKSAKGIGKWLLTLGAGFGAAHIVTQSSYFLHLFWAALFLAFLYWLASVAIESAAEYKLRSDLVRSGLDEIELESDGSFVAVVNKETTKGYLEEKDDRIFVWIDPTPPDSSPD